MGVSSEEVWIGRLLDVGRGLVTDLDLSVVLDRVLATARELTGARYAAIGVLNDSRTELSEFLTSGVDQDTVEAIGELPRGRGILGVLIEHPEPLRLTELADHPDSYGFPEGHPEMHGFLGVPVMIRGLAWGNLYLGEKEAGDFTDRDEQAAVILADWAAVAIDNARRYETSERRREELERAVRSLQATRDAVEAIGSDVALENVLALIAERGRALVHARSVVIMLREDERLVVRASAGPVANRNGPSPATTDPTCQGVLERGLPERILDIGARLGAAAGELGVEGASTALLVPMLYRGTALGVLGAFDQGESASAFTEEDEQMLRLFATSAATAVAMAQSVRADRLRITQGAADAERIRWARELHDETLQGLGGLRVLLSSALKRDDPQGARDAMREAVGRLEQDIENLRAIITDLRPAALDELGLVAAIEALVDRHRAQSAINVECRLGLAPRADGARRLDGELETAVYRLVQEALTNIARHSGARNVVVAVGERENELTVEVIDDGRGFDAGARSSGYGLAGIRERVALAGGTVEILSDENGTRLMARLPARTTAQSGGSGADEAAP
jgi:signal transduction histidine kinase